MLGLGASLSTSGGGITSLSPGDIDGLELWFKFNTGITGEDGGATADGDMADGEDIASWADQSGNNYHTSQSTVSRKPHWDTATADIGGLSFTASAGMAMTLAGDFTIALNTDFTIMSRVKVTDLSAVRTILGNTSQNVIKFVDNTEIKTLIGGTGAHSFVEASDTFATDVYYIITLTRSGTSAGNLEFRVHGGAYTDKSWDAADDGSGAGTADNDAFVIDNIGANQEGGAQPFDGFIKDILVWEGTALTAGQRNDMYTYITTQK